MINFFKGLAAIVHNTVAFLIFLVVLIGDPSGAPRLFAAGNLLKVLVLFPTNSDSINKDSFLLAISVQLKPFQWDVLGTPWQRPASLTKQRQIAIQLGRQGAASAVIWFTQTSRQAKAGVMVHVLDFTEKNSPEAVTRSMAMGRPGEGIERSMALAARTMLQSRLDHFAQHPGKEKTPLPGFGDEPNKLYDNDRLQGGGEAELLGMGYGIEFYPAGQGVRHGPDLHFSLLHRPLQGRLTFGYRFDLGRADEQTRWSSQVLRVASSLAYLFNLPHRLQLAMGLKAQISILFAEAQSLADNRRESDNTSELALGAQVGLMYPLWPRVFIELSAGINWIPLRYQLLIRGTEQVASGPLEISILPTIHVKIL